MKKILLLEDDRSLGEILSERLSKEGYQTVWVRTLAEAQKQLDASFDIAILDINLPDGSGLDFPIALAKLDIPFLFVTALADPETRLKGFELGAHEFIPKPFHLKELLLRLRHVLDNHQALQSVELEDVRIDFQRMSVRRTGQSEVFPPAREMQLLRHLVRRAPEVVSRDELLQILWGDEKDPSHRTIDNMVVKIRGFLGNENWIRAVRGVGYQWAGKHG